MTPRGFGWMIFGVVILIGSIFFGAVYAMQDAEISCAISGGTMVPGWRSRPPVCLPGSPITLDPKEKR